MMAEFMKQGAQKRSKGHHLMPLGRAHPQLHPWYPPAFGRIIQTIEFHPWIGGSNIQ
jgi:hypothetical protein